MHDIKINYGSGRSLRRSLPSSWKEISPLKRWELLRTVLSGAEILKITREYLSLPGWIEAKMDAGQWYDLMQSMSWLHTQLPLEEPLLHYICPRKVALYFPTAHFNNVTGREFALIDDMYHQEDQQDQIIAVLCRPTDPLRPASDKRIHLREKSQIDNWLQEVQAIPQELRTYLHAVFSGWKLKFYETYREWLFDPPGGRKAEDGDEQAEQSGGLNFGWWGAFMSVAEDGVFGTYDQVLDTPIHTICMHLVRKAEEAFKLQEEQDHAIARAKMK